MTNLMCCNQEATYVDNVPGKEYHYCRVCKKEVSFNSLDPFLLDGHIRASNSTNCIRCGMTETQHMVMEFGCPGIHKNWPDLNNPTSSPQTSATSVQRFFADGHLRSFASNKCSKCPVEESSYSDPSFKLSCAAFGVVVAPFPPVTKVIINSLAEPIKNQMDLSLKPAETSHWAFPIVSNMAALWKGYNAHILSDEAISAINSSFSYLYTPEEWESPLRYDIDSDTIKVSSNSKMVVFTILR